MTTEAKLKGKKKTQKFLLDRMDYFIEIESNSGQDQTIESLNKIANQIVDLEELILNENESEK